MRKFIGILLCFAVLTLQAQTISVGNGSYTKTFPGTDSAGRNGYPSGTPQLSGNAAGKPVPTNDWWSKLVKEDFADNLYNYPFAMKTLNNGLVVSYIPFGVMDDLIPITVGVNGLNVSKVTVSDHSDWTVTMNWNDGTRNMDITSGIGMPFLYITQNEGQTAMVTINSGTVTMANEVLIVDKAKNGASFAVYAPEGSIWSVSGKTYTSTLNNKNYWSVAMLPQGSSNITQIANEYKQYAYVFPKNTKSNFSYDEATSTIKTTFTTTVDIKEGSSNKILQGLLPHQWNNLAALSAQPDKYDYVSIRGKLKTIAANEFSTETKFKGILPTLPYVNNYSSTFNPSDLNQKIEQIMYDQLAIWTDSYNEGQVMNRLVQTARIADLTGNIEARDMMLKTVKERLENWFTASTNERAFIFYYNSTWSAMLGYPSGHGQDTNINDHHFHWGYFIHAAAFIEQIEPGWSSKWGGMVDMLVRDAASTNREDELFPYLRNFSPFAGHCWANGFASFPQGNDQESTSESMQFNSSLIHWGEITNNKAIRDLGIYLYTTEQAAIEEYWFDMYNRNFGATQQYSLVSRVWGNSYDNGTFWTGDIAASYGIELYPIHGGSLYLGHNKAYTQKLWAEIQKNTGIMKNEANPNLWHDIMWQYMAMIDAPGAIELYDSYPNRELKFGVSDAQTYHWLHSLNALGEIDATVTANYPITTVFNKNGNKTYVAHNYGNTPINVTFSDGYVLHVGANQMMTNISAIVNGKLTTSFKTAFNNGSVDLALNITQGTATKVEFYQGSKLLSTQTTAPFAANVSGLSVGKHQFYAKIYESDRFNVSNTETVIVGKEVPFGGAAWNIPGTIESGNYNSFEGGVGQNVAYFDMTIENSGDSRKDEYVDASDSGSEGITIHHTTNGEWLNYTVNVAESGIYKMDLRFACGNSTGGGKMTLELDNEVVATNINIPATASWETWATQTVNNIALKKGVSVLKVRIDVGDFNFGKMSFERTGNLDYSQPIAQLEDSYKVILPASTIELDGSNSIDPEGLPLSYTWEQINGASIISFGSLNSNKTTISGLVEGIYEVKLTVANSAGKKDSKTTIIIVSTGANILPTISITAPTNNSSFFAATEITIKANASDIDGNITKVEFYNGTTLLGTVASAPYETKWVLPLGDNVIKAIATDNENGVTVSEEIIVTGMSAPSCDMIHENGDFKVRFSEDASNPQVTFIPLASNIGNNLVILYYSTNASASYPGYIISPNTPTTITAPVGSTVHFYFTYSTPFGEKNTMGAKQSYTVGTCRGTGTNNLEYSSARASIYPNPTNDICNIVSAEKIQSIVVSDISGRTIQQLSNNKQVNLSGYSNGIYTVTVIYSDKKEHIKVIKQ